MSDLPHTADIIGASDAATIPALFAERVRRTPDRAAYRQWDPKINEWCTYSWHDISERVAMWRGGFVVSGLRPGDRVAVLLKNCVEWVCFDQAALGLGLVTVPLHVTDGPHNWADQLSDAGPGLLLVGDPDPWIALYSMRDGFPSLKHVVCLEENCDDSLGAVHIDRWLPETAAPPSADVSASMLATITYTSGTTGRPKGVMLTHRNIVTAVSATLTRNPGYLEDVFLSFLPMAHIFERTTEYYLAIASGGETAFARSIGDLPEDFAIVKPTVVMAVPRIFERVWKGIVTSASRNPAGRWLLRRAAVLGPDTGTNSMLERLQRWLIQRLVTEKLLQRFGGRLRMTVCGGAPLAPELARVLCGVGLPLIEGYGLAEAAGPVSGDRVADYRPGTVGVPLDGCETRISDTGEILLRSPSVMSGYWNRPEETAEMLDAEGWLHTGDVGVLQEGRLVIHGRVRDLIVLSTGEKLAPTDLESSIITDPLFEQAMVVGDKRPFVVALIVLDAEQWKLFAAEERLDPDEPNCPANTRAITERIEMLCKTVPDHAQVRRVWATFEPWTAKNGLLTVTLKLKREVVYRQCREQIEQLYRGHE